jgi:uncharacterized surface protein with fasciclin (FAS1) repeats
MKTFIHRLRLLLVAGAACIAPSEFTAAQEAPAPSPAPDLVAVAAGNADCSTLVSALRAADLTEALSGPGPFTVFAPNNDAFAKLPPGALEDLMKPANKKQLADILKNHVAQGKIMAADVRDGRVAMLGGETVETAVENGNIGFGGAKFLQVDLPASNGVIHVIDRVVMPD